METISTSIRPAGFWVRYAALWVDTIILSFITFLVILAMISVVDIGHNDPNIAYLLAYFVMIVLVFSYFVLFTGWKGQTLGKMLCGLTVKKTDGSSLGFGKAALREIIGKLLSSVLIVGFIWVAFSKEKRGWHDLIAETSVNQDMKVRTRAIITLVLALIVSIVLNPVSLLIILTEGSALAPFIYTIF
jgi:uncharacterized RDD family membrane protein YckC